MSVQGPTRRLPELLLRFFRWYCHPALRGPIEGDLVELYQERLRQRGRRYADLRLLVDVLLLLRPGIVRSVSGTNSLNQLGMITSYFRIAYRNLLKYRFFSAVNVLGLSAGMSVCMLIILMLADQRRYDKFHPEGDRTYRILSGTAGSFQPYATSPFPLAAALKSEYPIVEEAVTMMPGPAGDAIIPGKSAEMRGYFTDAAFFRVFGFQLERGDPASALTQPNSIVITINIARRLFGYDDPIGKTITFAHRQLSFPVLVEGTASAPTPWGTFTVTGLIDESKYKSHLAFDVLMSASTCSRLIAEKKWGDMSGVWDSYWRAYTYALVHEGVSEEELQASLNDLVARKYAGLTAEYVKDFFLQPQPMSGIQLGLAGNDTNNRLPDIGYYVLGALALIIMLTACLNYTNLSVARSLTRAREIGVRKVTGASRTSLVAQFLGESVLTSIFALAVGLLILVFLSWSFKGLWVNQFLAFELPATGTVIIPFLGFAILVGVIAGLYPALYLSRYEPVKVLKRLDVPRPGRMSLRKSLTVIQFVISLVFIATSILVFSQFKHYMNFNYGFAQTDIVNVDLQGMEYEKLANEFSSLPGVLTVSGCDNLPAAGVTNGDETKRANTDAGFQQTYVILASENFLDNLGLRLLAGKPLPPPGSGADNQIVVNEAVVRKLGYHFPEEIVGESLETKWSKEILIVTGVVEDFKHQLLINKHEVSPLMLRNNPEGFKYINVRLSPGDHTAAIAAITAKWKQLDPLHDIRFRYFDEELSATHRAIFDVVRILGFITLLAVFISCLGLLGMTTYTAERKRKEVGIRKVLGAGGATIALLLSKEFLVTISIAIAIGAPLSYVISNAWLSELPNRVDFSFLMFFSGVLFLLVLGVVTILSQTFRVSKVNPVEVLKDE